MEEKTLLDLACRDCDPQNIIANFKEIQKKVYAGVSSSELMEENMYGYNFMHLLFWMQENNNQEIKEIRQILLSMGDEAKLDVMRPSVEDGTILHLLLDEDNKMSKDGKREIIKSYFHKMPTNYILTILNIKDELDSDEPFNIDFSDKRENLGHLITWELGEDFLMEILPAAELEVISMKDMDLLEHLLTSTDEDGESLIEALTDKDITDRQELKAAYIQEAKISNKKIKTREIR